MTNSGSVCEPVYGKVHRIEQHRCEWQQPALSFDRLDEVEHRVGLQLTKPRPRFRQIEGERQPGVWMTQLAEAPLDRVALHKDVQLVLAGVGRDIVMEEDDLHLPR